MQLDSRGTGDDQVLHGIPKAHDQTRSIVGDKGAKNDKTERVGCGGDSDRWGSIGSHFMPADEVAKTGVSQSKAEAPLGDLWWAMGANT